MSFLSQVHRQRHLLKEVLKHGEYSATSCRRVCKVFGFVPDLFETEHTQSPAGPSTASVLPGDKIDPVVAKGGLIVSWQWLSDIVLSKRGFREKPHLPKTVTKRQGRSAWSVRE